MIAFKQLSRFGFIGILATAVHASVGLGLHEGVRMLPFWANLIAFCCALGVSFFGQTRLTFPDSTADGSAFVRFSVVAISGLVLNQTIVWVMTSVFASPYWLALAIIVCTVPGITFLLLKFWALER
ncbi:MAG: GtrA family protein [Alphaproteobacteria bacterium]